MPHMISVRDKKKKLRGLAEQRRREAKKAETGQSRSKFLEFFNTFLTDRFPRKTGAVGSAYVAAGAEIDPAPLLRELTRCGWSTALPRMEPDGMLSFRAWQTGDPLTGGKHGVREPLPETARLTPDLVIAPVLAFDARGGRLGRGGGYYDRALQALRLAGDVTVLGVAHDAQFFEALPLEPCDEKLDYVLTPSGVCDCGAGS